MNRSNLKSKLRLGLAVFVLLLVIEVTEYLVGTRMRSGAWPFLLVLAVVGALPILYYFMHIRQLSKPE